MARINSYVKLLLYVFLLLSIFETKNFGFLKYSSNNEFIFVGLISIDSESRAWCYKRETPDRKGVASSTFFLGLDSGTGIGAMVAGAVAQYLDYRSMYAFMLIPIVLSAFIFFRAGLAEKRGTQKTLQGQVKP